MSRHTSRRKDGYLDCGLRRSDEAGREPGETAVQPPRRATGLAAAPGAALWLGQTGVKPARSLAPSHL